MVAVALQSANVGGNFRTSSLTWVNVRLACHWNVRTMIVDIALRIVYGPIVTPKDLIVVELFG
jgi:hypothetical protein